MKKMKFSVLRSPCVLPHTKVCSLFGTSGCSEKSEVAKQLLHPKGCSLISLTSLNFNKVKMKNLFLVFIFIIFLTSFASAIRFEDNYMRYGTIDSSGNLHETSTQVNNVNVRGYVCSNSGCSSVSGNLWGGSVLSTSGNFIQLTYPTALLSSYGYGVYMYKNGYIPYEVSANWWGTCSSCDPQGPFYNFLTKKEVCFSNINSLQTIVSPGNINVNVSVHSPIDNAGPLNYIPDSLKSHYSANVSVNLEAIKNGSVVYSENKSVLIPFSGNAYVQFNVPVSSAGNYNIQAYTTTSDLKCISYSSDYENKTEIITCFENSDCGSDYYSDNFCIEKNVTKNFTSFLCNNPGLTSSYCSNSTISLVNKTCIDYCNNGICQNFSCHNDLECGSNSCLAGTNYCSVSGLEVYAQERIFLCNSPNTNSSYCSNSTQALLIGNCNYNCSLGRCIGN